MSMITGVHAGPPMVEGVLGSGSQVRTLCVCVWGGGLSSCLGGPTTVSESREPMGAYGNLSTVPPFHGKES